VKNPAEIRSTPRAGGTTPAPLEDNHGSYAIGSERSSYELPMLRSGMDVR